jgi:hypothetical protein
LRDQRHPQEGGWPDVTSHPLRIVSTESGV